MNPIEHALTAIRGYTSGTVEAEWCKAAIEYHDRGQHDLAVEGVDWLLASIALQPRLECRADIIGWLRKARRMLLVFSEDVHPEVALAADMYDVEPDEIYGESRTARVVKARNEAIRQFYANGLTVTEIAGVFGKHHTTVMHSLGQLGKGAAS